ncbi:MAG TPA: sialidase family protein [Candidatus Sulfotelmatobacter sp.]|nr:sialidase family protein [Candidatus Sulfotelmatobacter sp.]
MAHQIIETNRGVLNLRTPPMLQQRNAQGSLSGVTNASTGMIPISSPAFDYTLSRGGGFSQNDTSTAWCGPNIVTGYNDSSAVLMTLNNASGGLSFSGIAHSGDGGKSFTDLGYLDPGAASYNFLVGNPSVACANAGRFYYASIFATAIPSASSLVFKQAIAINTSTDGGRTWSAPTAAVLKNSEHILERESLAVDPSNPQRLYISYTDLGFETAQAGYCAGQSQMLINLVRSVDGGQTWTKPVTIRKVCGNSSNAVNGSQVAVSPSGLVYVAYLFYDNVKGRELIQLRKSADHGVSFDKQVDVTAVIPAGSDSMLQGMFLSNEYPSLAVDRSKGATRETLYLAWTDGRNRSQIDVFSGTGVYNFADILLVKSTDHGSHWSTPSEVSPVPSSANVDRFMPGVAVDSAGKLAVCYSDRRNDRQNDAIDHYCSITQDGGASFQDLRLTSKSWNPAHSTDLVLNNSYMQDYDQVSPDWTGSKGGFFAGFQFQSYGNPSAYGVRF